MKITRKFLEKHNACAEGKEFFLSENILDHEKGILNLLKKNKVSWANWLIVRLMTHRQKVQYAIFAAQQVLELSEAKYPTDDRPRNAINAALAYLQSPNKITANAAYAAYAAANAAAYAAATAAYAADAAASAAADAAA